MNDDPRKLSIGDIAERLAEIEASIESLDERLGQIEVGLHNRMYDIEAKLDDILNKLPQTGSR